MILYFCLPALAAPPIAPPPVRAQLVWRNGVGGLVLDAPGQHVSPDAPSSLQVGDLTVTLRGDPASLRFPVPQGALSVVAEMAVCTDQGGSEGSGSASSRACRSVRLTGQADVQARRGTLALAEEGASSPATAPPTPASGVVKVIDFGAVWCPPCNLLAAEILHDPEATAGVPIDAVDVDLPASWAAKDRYNVGGYPTMVAVDAAGVEIDRLVGYPGPAATRAWFARLAGVVPLEALTHDVLTGAAASSAARRLAEADRDDAAKALFPRAADNADLRIARLLVAPTEADARWLLHEPGVAAVGTGGAGDWVYAALDASPSSWLDVVALAPTVPPVQGADLLAAAAEHAPPDAAKALRFSALALLRGAQTGDPARDRGHTTFLADLMADTGDRAGALALLDHASAAFPGEFTFPYAAARLLLQAGLLEPGRLPEAEARARAALAAAWGDQRLRAAVVLAKTLAAEKRGPEAIVVLDDALANTPRPAAEVEVRTHRYVKEAEALRGEIGVGR